MQTNKLLDHATEEFVSPIQTQSTGTQERSIIQTRKKRLLSRIRDFSPVSLAEIQQKDLMNRIDRKYIFGFDAVSNFLPALVKEYNILEIGGKRSFTYENIYFDTPDFQFYRMHHNGKLNRYKVRYRHYKETDAAFFEFKFKSNKRRTIKERIPVPSMCWQPGDLEYAFLSGLLPVGYHRLEAKFWSRYKRLTLISKSQNERVTLDYSLVFAKPDQTQKCAMRQLMIAEIKLPTYKAKSRFLQILKKRRYRPTSFSKYCMGSLLLYPETLKANNFKTQLIKLHDIENGSF